MKNQQIVYSHLAQGGFFLGAKMAKDDMYLIMFKILAYGKKVCPILTR